MFSPITDRIEALGSFVPERIAELEKIFSKPTVIYIDWANVIHWQEKLDWHFHLERMDQFFRSFPQIKKTHIYMGTLVGNQLSEKTIEDFKSLSYQLATKPVKVMNLSMDVSSIPPDSPAIIKNFVKKSLLKKLDIDSIIFLNKKLKTFNQQGILKFEELKCNFDVEMGRDMLSDFLSGRYENFILWSGDSDFVGPIEQLLNDGKGVHIFSMAGFITKEIDELDVPIFDIRKIREFICWPREIGDSLKGKIAAYKSQGDPGKEAPKR